MLFCTLDFALLLVGSLVGYYLLPLRGRQVLLLGASYYFYSYWNTWYALILLTSTLIDYFAGRAIEDHPRWRKPALIASLVSNLGILGFFKYTNFGLDTLRPLLALWGWNPGTLDVLLPAGISFYTFQSMSYTIDVYRGQQKCIRDPLVFSLYISFFVQLVAGPIERACDLVPQLTTRHRFRFENLWDGALLFLMGVAKKLVIADRLTTYCQPMLQNPAAYSGTELMLASSVVMLALYFDFSSYTDMARGCGRMFGVVLSRNFNLPFAATSPADFWRRWHMTLSNWIRLYVFESLGGVSRKRPLFTLTNYLIAMGLIGLWHGAQWKYVVWGLIWGLILTLYFAFITVKLFRPLRKQRWSGAAGWLVAQGLVVVLSPLFFCPDFTTSIALYGRVFTLADPSPPDAAWWLGAVVVVAGFGFQVVADRVDFEGVWHRLHPLAQGCVAAVLFYAVVFLGMSATKQFMYFEF